MIRFLTFSFLGLLTTCVHAETLTIGLRADVTSMDPHFHVSGPNLAIASHIYEPLMKQDAQQKLIPCLAVSWKPISDLTWEFRLRENVFFHNGHPFTSEDVAYTIDRIQKGVGPLESFKTYIRFIDKIEILSPHILRITTEKPYPLLAWDIAMIGIVPNALGSNFRSDAFNKPGHSFGTGPYRFEKWRVGQDIQLVRNTKYWGEKEPWERVTFMPVSNDITRYNGLLSGDFDLIETIPVEELQHFKQKKEFMLFANQPTRLMYLCFDLGRKLSPYVSGKNGDKLETNPFLDPKVRKAFSFALDRDFLIQNFLGGFGTPAGQISLEEATGFLSGVKPDQMNSEQAKELLKEAGFPDGFSVTLSSPSGRYVNDQKVVQAIGSMLSRIGIDVKVEILPSNLFFSRSQKGDFTLSLGGWPVGRESLSPLQALFHSFDAKEGYGLFNRGRYSNKQLDHLIVTALMTMDENKRQELLKKANKHIVENQVILPLYFSVANWASKSYLHFQPRIDEYTLAMNIRRR